MFSAIIERYNAFAQSWAWWVGMSILDAAIVLAFVSLLWWAIRHKAPPQLGYLLFLLVPLKLFMPLHVSIPDRFFSWAPRMAAMDIDHNATPTAPLSAVPPDEKNTTFLRERTLAPAEFKSVNNERAVSPIRGFPQSVPVDVANRSAPSLFAWLMFAWVLGIFALLARLAHAQIRFSRSIFQEAKAVNPTEFSVDIEGLLNRMRIGRNIRIVESGRISSPVVWGIFRPSLILPAGFAASMSPKRLEWVLLHELAHVRRRDLMVNCFQRAAGILHFLNPSIWIANHMINRLREYACDDLALAYGRISHLESGEAFLGVIRYAASIERRPETNLNGALGVFESTVRASCFHRMKRLLDTNRRVSVKLRLGSLCLLLLTAVLALPQIRAANSQTGDETATEKTAEKTTEKKNKTRPENSGQTETKKKKEEKYQESIYRFNVVIARHVMLLEGKEIVTWPQIEEIISKRPNPSQTEPSFYFTNNVFITDLHDSAKKDIWRLHQKYNLIGHSEGSLSARNIRYDSIESAADLKPDESLRINGNVVNQKGDPISGAEVILVRSIDAFSGYNTHTIYLVDGRVRNPLEEEMTNTNDKGQFALYPPKNKNSFIIAMHPDGGIGYVNHDQFNEEHKIHLLPWAGLTSEFGKEPEQQKAEVRTRFKPSFTTFDSSFLLSNDEYNLYGKKLPEIEFIQYSDDGKEKLPVEHYSFKYIPPISETTISRSFPEKDGGAINLPGATVSLLPGETRRLDLGPLTKQQREQLESIRNNSNPSKKKAKTDTTQNSSDLAAISAQRFELTILGPDKKPVPRASVEIRGNAGLAAESVHHGSFTKKGEYGVFFQADADGSLILDLPKKPTRFGVSIREPGYGPYWAGWSSDEHPETIPDKFVAELDAAWSVGGVLVDDQGAPIEGAKFSPSIKFKMRPGDTKELGVGTDLTCDVEGKWQYDSVPASMNEVFVAISHPDFMPNRRSLTRNEFEIQAGSKPAAKITMQRGLAVTGKVTDETGKPISGALIRTKYRNDIREAKTNENGDYKLVGCEPEMARIVVSAKGQATDMKEVLIGSDMGPVNFEMKSGGKIRIRVLNEKGDPVPNARIFFQRWRGMFQYFEFDNANQYTDKNGLWQWNEAPLDEFKADICPPGGVQLPLQPLVARDEEFVFRTYSLLVITGNVTDAETKETIKSFRVVPGVISDEQSHESNIWWERNDGYLATNGQYRIQFNRGATAHLVRIEAEGYKVAESRKIKSNEGKVQIDFALIKADAITATVLTPDGRPAVGAKIALGLAGSQIHITNGNIDDRSTFASRQVTDNAGRFRFPSQDAAYQLVITHPSGFSYIKSAEKPIPNSISLTPWARVEGTFRVGSQLVPNVPIMITSGSINSYGDNVPNISTSHDSTTGADGRFVFERVFPGRGRIGREIVLMVNEGAKDVTSTSRIAAYFPAGKTTHIDLGGTGRPAVGKLMPPMGYNEKVLWNFAKIDIQVPMPKLPVPADIANDPEKYKIWMDAWQTTEEGKTWQDAYKAYEKTRETSPYIWATVDRDGSFRIDDISPGNYSLSVRFSEHPAGHIDDHLFSVPLILGNDATQPLDLGSLTLEKN